MKYKFTIQRVSYSYTHSGEVEADNEDDARDKVYDKSEGMDFSEIDYEYKIKLKENP